MQNGQIAHDHMQPYKEPIHNLIGNWETDKRQATFIRKGKPGTSRSLTRAPQPIFTLHAKEAATTRYGKDLDDF